MNIGFVHPALLWGLPAVLVPIIIHLINRRRARILPFPAFHFVKLSNKKLARALKLKQLLLLLLRCLLALFIVLLVAGPYTVPEGALLDASGDFDVPTSRVIILDASLSMRAKPDGKTVFETARGKTQDLIRGFPASDDAAVLPEPPPPGFEMPALGFDRGTLLRGLEKLRPSYMTADISKALERASALLRSSTMQRKAVYIVGDFAAGYEMEASPFADDPSPPKVILVDAREGGKVDNLSVFSLEAHRAYVSGTSQWNLQVTVANWGDEPVVGVPVAVTEDGSPAASGFLDIPPRSKAVKEFLHSFTKTGIVKLEALLPADALTEDDTRSLIIDTGREVKVLVINGEPSTVKYQDEVFYLDEALNPGEEGRSQINARTITIDQMDKTDFEKFDVVLLCHPTLMPTETAGRLTDFVGRGGGLLITAGPKLNIDEVQQGLDRLLPGFLRGEKATTPETGLEESQTALNFSQLDYTHPIFRIFTDETATSLYNSKTDRYFLFDADPSRPKTILARFTNLQPAMVETPYGKGRSILLTTTVDREWTNLPIQSAFLPLIQETVHYLAGRTGEAVPPTAEVGRPHTLQPPEGVAALHAQSPSEKVIAGEKTADGFRFSPIEEPGFWEVKGEGLDTFFAAGTEPAESDLKQVDMARAATLFGAKSLGGGGAESSVRTEYPSELAWLLMFLFAAEVFLLRRMR